MGRDATKAAGNPWYQARKKAAEYDDRLCSRESAAEQLGMSVSSLADAELGNTKFMPVDKAVLMADRYNAPWLLNHYCLNECPIGCRHSLSDEVVGIDRVTVKLLKSLKTEQLGEVKDTLLDIAADGKITADEKPALQEVLTYLDDLAKTVSELKTIGEMALNEDGDAHGSKYASAVIAVAVGELGYVEKASNSQLDSKTANPGSANWTKYARDFDEKYPKWYNGKKNGYEWCDMFVDWCFVTAFGYENALRLLCQPERSCGAGCTWSAKYYKQKGQFFTSNPQVGDQIFFGTSIDNCTHTGLVEKADSSKVYTIEGNTSNKCARRSYALNSAKIVGYGRPKYDGAGTTTPVTPTKPSAGGQTSGADYKIGDIVQFNGKTHYVSSQAMNGVPCKPGKAKVTSIAKGAKHPYHLVNQGGGCTVYGWVNAADIGADSGAEQAAYTVVAGDSLWGIAQKRLGNGNRYKEIMTLNGLSSTVIRPGQKLKLPS